MLILITDISVILVFFIHFTLATSNIISCIIILSWQIIIHNFFATPIRLDSKAHWQQFCEKIPVFGKIFVNQIQQELSKLSAFVFLR